MDAQGWRPIETAPKDGRVVLFGYWEQHQNEDGQWQDYWQQYLVFWDDGYETWADCGSDPCPFKACQHWAEIPPPPTKEP